MPAIDNMQDWYLISASSEDGYTELEFSRNFTTCDNESKDLNIEVNQIKSNTFCALHCSLINTVITDGDISYCIRLE